MLGDLAGAGEICNRRLMRIATLLALLGLALANAAPITFSSRVFVVTGATGRTGRLIYQSLKSKGVQVRALVRNATSARPILNCSKCDASEGIFVGDVTKPDTLEAVMSGATDLAIAVGFDGKDAKLEKGIEWTGLENQVAALTRSSPVNVTQMRVALISSMGTTKKNPPKYEGGTDLFWKLQGEAFLMSSGVGFTIIKPCGLSDKSASSSTLTVGHDDSLLGILFHSVSRGDVARLLVEALMTRSSGLRIDLCSRPGKAQSDLSGVLKSARWPWQQ